MGRRRAHKKAVHAKSSKRNADRVLFVNLYLVISHSVHSNITEPCRSKTRIITTVAGRINPATWQMIGLVFLCMVSSALLIFNEILLTIHGLL